MVQPTMKSVMCPSPAGLNRMVYWQWGDDDNNNVLICVHGLTRNGRDFDHLAQRLSKHYKVICPDVLGRGLSDYSIDPTLYAVPYYVANMVNLLAAVGAQRVSWLGTSMGGLIGLGLAGSFLQKKMQIEHNPLSKNNPYTLSFDKFILNDVGPIIELSAIERISQYVGVPISFDSLEQASQYYKIAAASFGPLTDDLWLEFAQNTLRKNEDGTWVLNYDPKIAIGFEQLKDTNFISVAQQLLWQAYNSIDCPILLLRGSLSDLLSKDVYNQMLDSNKNAKGIEFQGTGHAPSLMVPEQIDVIEAFLLN